MIPAEKLNEISGRLSIADLVGEYVSLKRSGTGYVALCPFHSEKTPSFNVIPAKEIFHCFGCGAGGDIFTFLMKIDGISFPEAVARLAARTGVVIEDRPLTDEEKRAKGEKEQYRAIMTLVASHYRDILTRRPEGVQAREYLQQRDVDQDTAAAYGLGYAFERRDSLVQALRAKSLSLELAARLGVVRNSERGWYDLFCNRLMFPIRDVQGQVIALAGRVLDSSLPKYINSPESPLYKKSNVLFGADLALREVRKSGNAVIVEGYFDHLALYRAGIKNVLATCGTALTDGHVALLKKHAERVYLLFDSDNAGRKAAVKAMELCLEQGLPVYVITLPAGDDPDSFLKNHSPDEFSKRVETAKPALEQFVHWLIAKTPASSSDNKARLAMEIIPRLAKISERMERDLYVQEICRLLGIDDVAGFRRKLQQQMGNRRSMPVSETEAPGAVQTTRRHQIDQTQEMMLGILSRFPDTRDELSKIGAESVFDGIYLNIARRMLTDLPVQQDAEETLKYLLVSLDEEEQREIVTRLMVASDKYSDIDWKLALRQCLKRREQYFTGELKQISSQLAVIPADSPEFQELLKRAEQLRNRKSAIK